LGKKKRKTYSLEKEAFLRLSDGTEPEKKERTDSQKGEKVREEVAEKKRLQEGHLLSIKRVLGPALPPDRKGSGRKGRGKK